MKMRESIFQDNLFKFPCHCGLDPQSRNMFRALKLDSGSPYRGTGQATAGMTNNFYVHHLAGTIMF